MLCDVVDKKLDLDCGRETSRAIYFEILKLGTIIP